MARSTAKFTQADIVRALKAAQSVGFEVDAIELRPDGVLQISRHAAPTASTASPDPFEAWKAKRDARQA
jgi:hypothetical protein